MPQPAVGEISVAPVVVVEVRDAVSSLSVVDAVDDAGGVTDRFRRPPGAAATALATAAAVIFVFLTSPFLLLLLLPDRSE